MNSLNSAFALLTSMIINLTQHPATSDQLEAGVVDLPVELRERISKLLTFSDISETDEVSPRAAQIHYLVEGWLIEQGEDFSGPSESWPRAMIGGAAWLMGPLADQLREQGIKPLFAFSRRESVEEIQPDGSVRKAAVFRHVGFVEA